MEIKGVKGSIEIKSAAKGQVTAVFATFNVKDKDGDVTLPGAFKDNGPAVVSYYGHSSYDGRLPVGHADLREEGDDAIADVQFYMDTTEGKDAFTTVKRLAEKGLGEWSYGYDPVVHHFGEWTDGSTVRFLSKQKVNEVSPVLIGAGVGTRTVSAKGGDDDGNRAEYRSAIRPHQSALSTKSWDAAAVLDPIGALSTVDALRSMFAWVDPTGDPEKKSSYRHAHHDALGGPANIRACLQEIALLNSGRDIGLPEADRKGVYAHLAGHLADADYDAPELAPVNAKSEKLADRLSLVLADLGDVRKLTAETLARRAVKGKGLAPIQSEILGWVNDELGELRSLLDTPDEDVHRQFAAYIQSLNRS